MKLSKNQYTLYYEDWSYIDNFDSINLNSIEIENIKNDILNYLFKENYHAHIYKLKENLIIQLNKFKWTFNNPYKFGLYHNYPPNNIKKDLLNSNKIKINFNYLTKK